MAYDVYSYSNGDWHFSHSIVPPVNYTTLHSGLILLDNTFYILTVQADNVTLDLPLVQITPKLTNISNYQGNCWGYNFPLTSPYYDKWEIHPQEVTMNNDAFVLAPPALKYGYHYYKDISGSNSFISAVHVEGLTLVDSVVIERGATGTPEVPVVGGKPAVEDMKINRTLACGIYGEFYGPIKLNSSILTSYDSGLRTVNGIEMVNSRLDVHHRGDSAQGVMIIGDSKYVSEAYRWTYNNGGTYRDSHGIKPEAEIGKPVCRIINSCVDIDCYFYYRYPGDPVYGVHMNNVQIMDSNIKFFLASKISYWPKLEKLFVNNFTGAIYGRSTVGSAFSALDPNTITINGGKFQKADGELAHLIISPVEAARNGDISNMLTWSCFVELDLVFGITRTERLHLAFVVDYNRPSLPAPKGNNVWIKLKTNFQQVADVPMKIIFHGWSMPDLVLEDGYEYDNIPNQTRVNYIDPGYLELPSQIFDPNNPQPGQTWSFDGATHTCVVDYIGTDLETNLIDLTKWKVPTNKVNKAGVLPGAPGDAYTTIERDFDYRKLFDKGITGTTTANQATLLGIANPAGGALKGGQCD